MVDNIEHGIRSTQLDQARSKVARAVEEKDNDAADGDFPAASVAQSLSARGSSLGHDDHTALLNAQSRRPASNMIHSAVEGLSAQASSPVTDGGDTRTLRDSQQPTLLSKSPPRDGRPPLHTSLSPNSQGRQEQTMASPPSSVPRASSRPPPVQPPRPPPSIRRTFVRSLAASRQRGHHRRTSTVSTLTIEGLRAHTPFETEAEALLQAALDETDPTPSAAHIIPSTTLLAQPFSHPHGVDDASAFSAAAASTGGGAGGSSSVRRLRPAQAATAAMHGVGARLYGLTLSIRHLGHEGVDEGDFEGDSALEAIEGAGATDRGAGTKRTIMEPLVARHFTGPAEEFLLRHRPKEVRIAPLHDNRATFTVRDRMECLGNLFVPAAKAVEGLEEGAKVTAETAASLARDVGASFVRDAEKSLAYDAGLQEDMTKAVASEYKSYEDWFRLKKMGIIIMFLYSLCIMIPAVAVSALLFYSFGNPPCQNSGVCRPPKHEDDALIDYLGSASASWWILFLCCRQVITAMLSKATDDVLVEYLVLRSNWSVRLFGPHITLFIVLARGWPVRLFLWALYDVMILYGKHSFAQHWLFYQSYVTLMNDQNPDGGIAGSSQYLDILLLVMIIAAFAAAKRVWLGIVLGRNTFKRYSGELANVMARSVLVGKVAALAREIDRSNHVFGDDELPNLASSEDAGSAEGPHASAQLRQDNMSEPQTPGTGSATLRAQKRRKIFADNQDDSSRRIMLDELLGDWDDVPEVNTVDERPSIGAIIQFQRSTACLTSPLPFGACFGFARNRVEVLESTEAVYKKLLSSVPSRDVLPFDVIALLAVKDDGEVDKSILKDLVKLFPYNSDGTLSLLDFAKDIDSCYKELRLLRANIKNSYQLDQAFENIINTLFYILLFWIIIGIVGANPALLWGAAISLMITFKFMIGTGCSDYFTGILMVLCQRPYDIGDRIATSYPYLDTSTTGSSTWMVKDVTLYSTTVMYGSTNEVATHSNGALSTLRIINGTRSPRASLRFVLKFPINTPFSKIQLFKDAMEKFVRARKREWVRLAGIGMTSIETDFGYAMYTVIAIHRESWNNSAALSNSKADLQAFANELSKQLGMKYTAPPVPIDATLDERGCPRPSQVSQTGHLQPLEQPRDVEAGEGTGVAQSVAAMFGTNLSP